MHFRYSYRDAEWPFLGDKKYFSKFRKLFQKCHYRKVFLANDQKYFSVPRNTFLCLEILFYEFLCHTNECAKNYFSVFRITFLEKIISYSPKKHQHLLFCVMPKATCVYLANDQKYFSVPRNICLCISLAYQSMPRITFLCLEWLFLKIFTFSLIKRPETSKFTFLSYL